MSGEDWAALVFVGPFVYGVLVMVSALLVQGVRGEMLEPFPKGALVWPLWVPFVIAVAIAQKIASVTGERGRLRRELRALERERAILALRAKVEREREAFRHEFDRYITEGSDR